MKVSDIIGQSARMTEPLRAEDRRVASTRQGDFRSALSRVEGDQWEEHIADLVGRITAQGERLAKRVDVAELKRYKALISEFLEEAVSNSRKFSKENLLDRRGRYKVYASVKKVNEKLDDLTKAVLAEEKDNLQVLGCIQDIRGLILDIQL